MDWWKQRCTCYLNVLYMKKKEKDGEGLKDGMDEYELIKGYHVRGDEIEKETMVLFCYENAIYFIGG